MKALKTTPSAVAAAGIPAEQAPGEKTRPILGVLAASRVARALFWVTLSLMIVNASLAMLGLLADPAHAQGVGGGSSGNIEAAMEKFYDWLQGLMMLLAGIGFLIAAAWWAFAGSNQQRKAQGTGGMICALGAFAAAALVPDFLAAVAEWTGHKGA